MKAHPESGGSYSELVLEVNAITVQWVNTKQAWLVSNCWSELEWLE